MGLGENRKRRIVQKKRIDQSYPTKIGEPCT